MLGSKILAPVFLAALIGGCPKRQATPRIVYVQPPPAPAPTARNSSQTSAEALVIQEPAQAPAEEAPHQTVAPPPNPTIPPDKSKRPRSGPRENAEKPAPEPPQPIETPEAPLLAAQGADNEAALQARLDQLGAALNDLSQLTNLSEAQTRTIKDAAAFRSASQDALRGHDLLRAAQLADKAEVLIKAVH